ncbi:MAG TPA: peptidylprolyl isomerase [Puia sp.]|nr:peptidylprolyl isomerase [Puia sp.]
MNAKLLSVSFSVFFFLSCSPRVNLVNPGGGAFHKKAPSVFNVLLETSKGEILLEVHRDWSPHGVDRFYNLVRTGYYDNNYVFRIRAGTWAQFGINGDPEVARAWRGQTLPDDVRKESNTRGTVAYAFKDPNGRTTQVFINLRDNSATHDGEPFVPFARVVRGMEVADLLYAGYGEKSGGGIRAGHQDPLFTGGNEYLRQHYPLLDSIRRARVVK